MLLHCVIGASFGPLDQQEMSEDNRRYLTMKQFEAGIVIDDTMLEILRVVQVLRNPEMRQIRSQMTMDQRRERLFDTLKRKPDSLFVDMKALFNFRATSKLEYLDYSKINM